MDDVELVDSARVGDLHDVKTLLELGADIDEIGDDWTALMWASQKNNLDITTFLLEQGANVNTRGGDGWTALMSASCEGHIETVELLLKWGAKIDIQDNEGSTALMWTLFECHFETVELLLEQNPSINIQSNECKTFLDQFSNKERREKINGFMNAMSDLYIKGGD